MTCPHGFLDHAECRECDRHDELMSPDDMALELRAAGWREASWGWWMDPALGEEDIGFHRRLAHKRMRELARQAKAGTVNTPVVGQGEENG